MVTINTISETRFTFNGVEYFKNFTPVLIGSKIKIINTYDSRIYLCQLVSYEDYILDGNTYASAEELQSALLPAVYTRNSLGGGTGVWGTITGNVADQTDLIDYIANNGGGGSTTITTTTITNTTTVFDGTQKGQSNIYKFNNVADQTVELNPNDYTVNDIIIFQRGELGGGLEILASTGIMHKGVRDIDNRFRVQDPNSMVFAKLDTDGRFLITGNLVRGYSGAVQTSNYTPNSIDVNTTATITVIGTGFSQNMLVTLTGNATLNGWDFISSTSITLNITTTGVLDDMLTINYDNGDASTDTDAIVIASVSTFLYNEYPFDWGVSDYKLRDTITSPRRVRRATDNAEVDILFDNNNKVSLSSLVTGGDTLSNWASTGDIYTVTRYGQGTLAYNLTQSDTTKQPLFMTGGVIVAADGDNFEYYDGSNDVIAMAETDSWLTSNFTVFAHARVKDVHHNGILLAADGGAGTNRIFQLKSKVEGNFQLLTYYQTVQTLNSVATNVNQNYQVCAYDNGVNTEIFVDGVSSGAVATLNPNTTVDQSISMGMPTYSSNPFKGNIGYGIFYKSDQSANRANIETFLANLIAQ